MSGALVRCPDRRALDVALEQGRATGAPLAFVPTMGALHVGHLTLVERAATLAPTVVVSIFVNPTQFDASADLASYPRTLDTDLALLTEVAVATGVRVVAYVPRVDDVYPDGPAATLHIPEVTDHLCGASRPGHFDGVATVVDRLLRIVRPTVVVMGRKDHQQLVVVRRLIALQGHDVTIDAAPTVRDGDGVAVSSRNALLDAAARLRAGRVPRALAAGVDVARRMRAEDGAVDPGRVRGAALAVLEHDGLRLDYLATVDPQRIVPVDGLTAADTEVLLAVAVHVASGEREVRLIDNVLLGDHADEQRLLDAVGQVVDLSEPAPEG